MRASSFPWRLFRRFFILVFSSLFLITSVSLVLDLWILQQFAQSLQAWLLLGFVFLTSLLASAAVAWQVVKPFHRTLMKAVRISSKKRARALFGEESFDEYLSDEEPGEFAELESVLDQIEEKLKRRKIQLMMERQESKALLSSIEHAIVTVDLDLKVTHFNSEFATHFLSREQVRQHTEGEALNLELVFREPLIRDLFQTCTRERRSLREFVRLQSYMQSPPKDFAVTLSPLRDERTQEVYGALALLQDLTELKKSEQVRIEFIENASHELRTPLTSIKGFLSALKEDLDQKRYEQIPDFLQIILRSVDRLSALVQDMLSLASLEHSNEFSFDEVPLLDLTQEAIERLAPLANEKGIVIHSKVEVASLQGDEKKLLQVLTNLLGNAIKYIPRQGEVQGDIKVSWTKEDSHIVLRVRDNGPGIAPEHHDRLFERFYRIDRGRSRDSGGTGLGLAIAKHIVVNHGGTIRVESKWGQGAEFICEFPEHRPSWKNLEYDKTKNP